jgi:uncharacterized iron-regulated protein
MHLRTLLLGAVWVPALLSGCASAPQLRRAWHSERLQEHPLVGRAWDVQAGRFVSLDQVEAQLRGARYVLLGETHDNPDHHLLQAELLKAVVRDGRRPALAFEMLDTTQQEAVDQALAQDPKNPDAIADAVAWGRTGWPPFSMYRPIFQAGLEAGLKVVAANLPRTLAAGLMHHGPMVLEEGLRERLERAGPLPDAAREAMREEMRHAHCGEFPEAMLEPLVLAQRVRDVQLAERLAAGDEGQGGVLITGTGHARNDRGVPALLRLEAPGQAAFSVGLLEVAEGVDEPARYAARFGTERLPFDVVVFTPGKEREDPCEALRRHHPRPKAPAPPHGAEQT